MIRNPGKKYQYGDFIRDIFYHKILFLALFCWGVDVMGVGLCVRARVYIYNQLVFISKYFVWVADISGYVPEDNKYRQ